jgi:hypothetical protein
MNHYAMNTAELKAEVEESRRKIAAMPKAELDEQVALANAVLAEVVAEERAVKHPVKWVSAEFVGKKQEFKRLFKTSAEPFLDMEMFRLYRSFCIDTFKLEDWLVKTAGYELAGGQSLADFIEVKYGKAARDFVEANI